MKNVKVTQMTSNRTGEAVRNQLTIRIGKYLYFQSYDSIIVKIDTSCYPEKVWLDCNYWDYSKTTGKYRNQFLGESKAETQKKIADGSYKLVNLNGK